MQLSGRVALVTGGSRGIGRGISAALAAEGAAVAVNFRASKSSADEVVEAITAAGGKAVAVGGDVAEFDQAEKVVAETIEQLGGLDILVNNAAYQQHQESLADISDAQLARTFHTNIFGYFYMARAALRHLQRGGVILNTGSVTGMDGSPGLLDYAATKGAIHAFTKSLAQNLVKQGIRVNGVAPGPVWTPLNPADQEAKKVAEFGSDVNLKRAAQPEEIAPAYVFLAAESDASYITGEVLSIFGGEPTN
jgi:NAD(P)-dependent dehydrogenase (short-subunit alcohol dehydrogenase family)